MSRKVSRKVSHTVLGFDPVIFNTNQELYNLVTVLFSSLRDSAKAHNNKNIVKQLEGMLVIHKTTRFTVPGSWMRVAIPSQWIDTNPALKNCIDQIGVLCTIQIQQLGWDVQDEQGARNLAAIQGSSNQIAESFQKMCQDRQKLKNRQKL